MDSIYGFLLESVKNNFDVVRVLKSGPRGTVEVLRHKVSGSLYVFRRFSGNAEVYRKLLHVDCPYLPKVFEAVEQDGEALVLEEYIQGDTLSSLLDRTQLSPPVARKIVKQLCSALWVLHSMGAVHRDIKPENIILRGEDAVLIDFDSSRLVREGSGTDTQILGTAGFAPPEQYGLSQTDGRADIYALGVLLNFILTGMHPAQKLAAGRMGRIVQRCTMTNPKNRYQSILHLMEALS